MLFKILYVNSLMAGVMRMPIKRPRRRPGAARLKHFSLFWQHENSGGSKKICRSGWGGGWGREGREGIRKHPIFGCYLLAPPNRDFDAVLGPVVFRSRFCLFVCLYVFWFAVVVCFFLWGRGGGGLGLLAVW